MKDHRVFYLQSVLKIFLIFNKTILLMQGGGLAVAEGFQVDILVTLTFVLFLN